MDKLPKSTGFADLLWKLTNATGKPGTKKESISRLLDMLAIFGIVTKKADMYANTPPAGEYSVALKGFKVP